MRCWQLDVERQLALDSRVRTDAVVTDEVVDHFGPRGVLGKVVVVFWSYLPQL